MSLRAKILIYLVAIHLLLGVVAGIVLWDRRAWLLVAEALFAASVLVGYRLVRQFFVPLDLIHTGAELIRERDFSSRFREMGQPEMDRLIRVYNEMIDALREERLKLAEQHVLLDKILRASPAGILILDFDGRVALSNPAAAALLRQPEERLLGRPVAELPEPLGGRREPAADGGSTVLPLASGRRVRCRRTEFLDRGFPRSFLLLEELTEELRASEKAAYDKLIRMMSHEINNSVGAVRSLLESCRSYAEQLREADREDYRGALEVARRRLDNLNAFVHGFAEVVRLPDPARRPSDPTRLVGEIVRLMSPELERRRIRCTVEVAEPPPPPVELDPHQMEQVLVNVIQNAMESIGEGGSITVRCGQERGAAFVAVSDDGPGIPPEVRERLFTPFFSTKRDGRGIGLTVVREVLSRHGFDFTLENRAAGGAEFRIVFA